METERRVGGRKGGGDGGLEIGLGGWQEWDGGGGEVGIGLSMICNMTTRMMKKRVCGRKDEGEGGEG